jgi:hypothetical protein
MGVWEPLLPPIGPSDLEFTLKSNITICETLSPGIYAPSSPGFLDDEFPSDDDILEDMIMEPLKVGRQVIWLPCSTVGRNVVVPFVVSETLFRYV